MALTVNTFGPDNRIKHIGHSMYRIAADGTKAGQAPTLWHIYESYNNLETGEWGQAMGFYTTDLQKAIDAFNSITRERQIIGKELDEKTPQGTVGDKPVD